MSSEQTFMNEEQIYYKLCYDMIIEEYFEENDDSIVEYVEDEDFYIKRNLDKVIRDLYK